jgi:hypothetical protein
MDLQEHLKRQIAFSRATFGPSERRAGVIDHIRKELVEVAESGGDPEEWTDVVILALDGLTRSLVARGYNVEEAAGRAVRAIERKQGKNELRTWPDWRTVPEDRAIEHDRSKDYNRDRLPKKDS